MTTMTMPDTDRPVRRWVPTSIRPLVDALLDAWGPQTYYVGDFMTWYRDSGEVCVLDLRDRVLRIKDAPGARSRSTCLVDIDDNPRMDALAEVMGL